MKHQMGIRGQMLTIYEIHAGELKVQTGKPKITDQTVWIDLLNPSQEEEDKVETSLGIDVPTREEQQEIEVSDRLYQEDSAHFMTATLLYQGENAEAKTTPVNFILAGQRLVTVRYAEPRAFNVFVSRCNRSEADFSAGTAILVGLLDIIVDRLADFIERIQVEVEALSHSVFETKGGKTTRPRRFDVLLRSIGREGEIASKARESGHSLGRLLTFLSYAVNERKDGKPLQQRVRTAARAWLRSLTTPRFCRARSSFCSMRHSA